MRQLSFTRMDEVAKYQVFVCQFPSIPKDGIFMMIKHIGISEVRKGRKKCIPTEEYLTVFQADKSGLYVTYSNQRNIHHIRWHDILEIGIL